MSAACSSPIWILHSTLIELSWTEASLELFSKALAGSNTCLLTVLLNLDRQQVRLLSATGRDAITTLCSSGFQLLPCWPRESTRAVAEWLGERFYWLNPRAVSEVHNHRLCSIVSSQLGKDKQQLAFWPTLLEWAIELAARDKFALLVAQGTTLDTEARKFADAAKVPLVEIFAPKLTDRPSATQAAVDSRYATELLCVAWLKSQLESYLVDCFKPEKRFHSLEDGSQEIGRIELSPSWLDPDLATGNSTAERDRATVALADRVCCVWIRSGGKIAQLVEKRLQDHQFPAASCFIALPQFIHVRRQDWRNQNNWLGRGAVGYMVQVDDWKSYSINWLRCTQQLRPYQLDDLIEGPVLVSSVQQISLPLHRWLENQHQGTWNYLTHCTRGNSAAWPQESSGAYIRRVWNEGATLPADPLVMLMHILQEGRLRGSNRLTRGSSPVVSLSKVPLVELLERRSFKRHLNKWDWEPYGLLFHRDVLPQAKPVKYGDESLFATLPAEERFFFQPIDGRQDWSSEQEWRVLGDIDLRALPAYAAMVFTKTRNEALQLAWISPFPIVWIEA